MPKIQGFKKLAFWPMLPFRALLGNRELFSFIVSDSNKKSKPEDYVSSLNWTCNGYDDVPIIANMRNKSFIKRRPGCFIV